MYRRQPSPSKSAGVIFMMILLLSFHAWGQSRRVLVFEDNDTLNVLQQKIEQNNYHFTVTHNWVFDMPRVMKKAFFSRHLPVSKGEIEVQEDIGPLQDYLGISLPDHFDWRNYEGHSYVGPVRNQGNCGDCYAFGALAAAENVYNQVTGSVDDQCVDFSEAFLAFCLSNWSTGFHGCLGADYDYEELDALVNEGVPLESALPYKGRWQFCRPRAWDAPRVTFSEWHRIPCGDIDAIKTAIMVYGVVDAAVYASSAFQAYQSGVYEDARTACNASPCYYTTTNHAIALVGWDDADQAWILRNSWGPDWGEEGYMRIKYEAARVSCEATYLVY